MTVVGELAGVAVGEVLLGQRPRQFRIEPATDRDALAAYRQLRHRVFVEEQGLFARHDIDEYDDDPRTVVLVGRDGRSGDVLGGVRLGPVPAGADIGWWHGGRLVTRPGLGIHSVGSALVRAACAHAEASGVLRFDATVQTRNERFFAWLGWQRVRPVTLAGAPHVLMRWPIGRIAALAAATKAPLGGLLAGMAPGGPGFVGDDGAPVPGSDLVAACDAILPSMVEHDPEWAGWCSVLVNLNDLAAMGAEPVGLLDAVGARDAASARRVLDGLRRASAAYQVPVLGGHTQLGVPPSLSVTALGRAAQPVPGGGGRPGHRVRLTVDLCGDWRPGYTGRQWDSTSTRSTAKLRAMLGAVRMVGTAAAVSGAGLAAAKDVSMAGVAGTLGMLAEASGCGAILDVAAVPRPAAATMCDWLTCFPGFGMLTAGGPALAAGPATGAECGELVPGAGVELRWPDGELTPAIEGPVTGMGPAVGSASRMEPAP
jgi:putative N-acetyltransferase (TIGR04045 family)